VIKSAVKMIKELKGLKRIKDDTYMDNSIIKLKEKRISDVVALQEPDRVPFVPQIATAYTQCGHISKYEAMTDFRNFIPGVRYFLNRYDVDLFWNPETYLIPVLECLDTDYIKWPGPASGLPLDSGFQILDKTYLNEDEYDAFLSDPSYFMLTRVYSGRHKKLRGLEKLKVNAGGRGHLFSMAAFGDPELREAFDCLAHVSGLVEKWENARRDLVAVAYELNTPIGNGAGGTTAYDTFADSIRGYMNVPMDLFTIPEKVVAACEEMDVFSQRAVEDAAKNGSRFFFVALHGGQDEMMSTEMYNKYYWPFLQRHIERIVNNGMTPFILTEGFYNTRLETLKDVPRGKVIYAFEKVDMIKAKKMLGDTACICGNIASADLIFGKKEKIVEDTRRMLETCAPGGGFIMSNSISLDHYNEENFDAWYETTLKYGNY